MAAFVFRCDDEQLFFLPLIRQLVSLSAEATFRLFIKWFWPRLKGRPTFYSLEPRDNEEGAVTSILPFHIVKRKLKQSRIQKVSIFNLFLLSL